MKKSKLLLDCMLIITSVVPPELPMELSLAVNASLVALSKYGKFFPFCLRRQLNTVTAIFCTEPFRIPFAGRVDVCCFDKTGTITAENLVLEGVVGVECVPGLRRSCGFPNFIFSGGSSRDRMKLVDVKETERQTKLCLVAAHALVQLDDGTIVGDPMEKTTLEALDWKLLKGAHVS